MTSSGRAQNGFSLVHLTAQKGHDALAKLLVERGAEPNGRSQHRNRETPLHCAARSGKASTVQALVALGADMTLKDKVRSCAAVESSSLLFHLAFWLQMRDHAACTKEIRAGDVHLGG